MKITPTILNFNFSEIEEHNSNNDKIHFEDMSGVNFLSNWDIVRLINTVKEGLSKGFEVKFINVKDEVRKQITDIDSDNILNIS